jgi:N-hydroxyarylamine O-acetyltransferase
VVQSSSTLTEAKLDIEAYLKRINYTGSLAPTADTLRELHVAHLQTVPFENLSIHAGQPIVLEDRALFTKIVEKSRGGFCYEANGLFAALLRSLGYEVAMLAAGVAGDSGDFSPDFDHMCLMVTIPDSSAQRWLADVGFGDLFMDPLRLETGEQEQGTRAYRIVTNDPYLVLEQRNEGEDWKPQYRFTLEPYAYSDYEERSRFHQTSPDSHFTKGRICSRATKTGRISLSDMRLIITTGSGTHQEREERTLTSDDEYIQVLRDEFGVAL